VEVDGVRLLVDTNRYAVIVGNKRESVEYLSQAEEVWLSLITIGELLAGFALGRQREFHEERLNEVLDVQGVGVLRPDFETARIYARVHRELRQQGRPIPTNDMWIAALALQHGLALDTRDVHFQQVPGLTLV
jgi:tRNA(fMet)-specific endonuclease VapC